MRPIELPPPSAYSTELVDAILNLCRGKMSFNAYEALFFIAQFYLPLFKFVKMPIKDIFELCFAAKHDSTQFSPFFAAAAFLDNLLEQPQFTDEFFEWVFEKMDSFDELRILMATTMIHLKVARKKTCIASIAILMKNTWPQVAAELLGKEYTIAKDAIIKNIISITEKFYKAMNEMTEKGALTYQSLMEGEKIFTTIFGYLPMESIFRNKEIIEIDFFQNSVTSKLFTYRHYMPRDESPRSHETLRQILNSNDVTPEEVIDPLPDSVNAEAYQNYSDLLKANVLQQITYQFKVTPEFEMLAAREEPWVLYFLKQKPTLLLMPSHYLKILRIIKESEQLEKIEELPTQETVALEFYLQPEIISAVTKIPFDITQKLIKEMIKSPIMEETLLTNTLENIEEAKNDQLIACIDILSLMSDSENTKEMVASSLPSILEFCISNRETNDANVIKKVCEIITKTNVFPEKVIHLIGFAIISRNLEKYAIEVYSKLPKEQKTECGYIIEAALRKALNGEKSSIMLYLNKCPELAKTYSADLLKLADKCLQNNERAKIELVGSILSSLSPEQGSLSISSVSVEAKIEESSAFPIPASIIAQNPDFWNVIKKNLDKITEIISKKQDLLNTAFSFMSKFPLLIPFEQRVYALRNRLQEKAMRSRYAGGVSLNIDRKHILEDTFASIGMSPASKLMGRIRVSFKNEVGVDAGGLLRGWFTDVISKLFDPDYLLFIATSNKLSYQPNYESSYNPQHLNYFRMTGRLIARAIIEGISVPAHFTQGILKCILNHSLTLKDLEVVDDDLYRSLSFLRDNDADECYLTFERTIKGLGCEYTIKLKTDGDKIDVTNENKEEYIQLMINDVLYRQTKAQIDAIVNGFHEIIPAEELKAFNSRELNLIICGLPQISIDDLEANVVLSPPYTKSSPTIKALFNVLRKWNNENRSLFLLFVTASSKLPVGGFSKLEHRITISRLPGIENLPRAHTCFNNIELPDYKDEALLESKLLYAIQNAGSFELA